MGSTSAGIGKKPTASGSEQPVEAICVGPSMSAACSMRFPREQDKNLQGEQASSDHLMYVVRSLSMLCTARCLMASANPLHE
jgi:hypothetical protein